MDEPILTMNDYQDMALSTWSRTPSAPDADLAYLTLGLVGETGEVAEHIKKHLRHGKLLDRDALRKELGDAQWYIAVLSHELGFKLEDVGAENILKLKARYPQGFAKRWSDGA